MHIYTYIYVYIKFHLSSTTAVITAIAHAAAAHRRADGSRKVIKLPSPSRLTRLVSGLLELSLNVNRHKEVHCRETASTHKQPKGVYCRGARRAGS